MAKYKKGQDAKYADTLGDDANGETTDTPRRKKGEPTKEMDGPVYTSCFNLDGSPLSAIQQHLLPFYVENKELFNEFGFRREDDTFSENSSLEDPADRMKWIALLEFAHDQVKDELTWSKVDVKKLNGDKLDEMVKKMGIVHSFRPFLWPRLSGAAAKKESAGYSYDEVLRQSANDKPSIGVQIERDLLRTLPNNVCFWRKDSSAIEELRRLLKAVAYIYPDLGYCQGMGVVIGTLMLVCPEETVFWMMTALIEDILPPNYYSQTLLGLQADERVARQLIKTHTPDLFKTVEDYDVEISLVTVNWLLTVFSSCLPTRVLLRVWDLVFTQGGVAIFRVLISMLKIREEEIVELGNSTKSSADVFNAVTQLPQKMTNVEQLLEYVSSFEFSITELLITELRRKFQAVLMADQGMIVNTSTDTNLPKQKMTRRKLARSKSVIQQLFSGKDEENDPKTKNVRQTEILVDLKESILQICRYFMNCDDKMEMNITTQADYTPESHAKDLENFLNGHRQGHKRARALLDFERQDEDELGFRKNDVITVICEKDEHCWVGEVNGLRGWFPAKFVEVVDERGKAYTIYGDEAVCPEVTEYVRGRLANAFRQVVEHGIRQNALYPTSAYHPWAFIEDIAYYSVEKHFNSVYSRLTLCSTFKLDQDGKILTPEELLFRSVQRINDSHNMTGAHPDVKLRSLLVVGVNEQVLHLWFELFCASEQQEEIRKKYYHSWAFIRTPAWKQIKCDLRLLAQFSFNLHVDFELEGLEKKKKNTPGMLASTKTKILSQVLDGDLKSPTSEQPLREGVRDMLIKHHLFSWDL